MNSSSWPSRSSDAEDDVSIESKVLGRAPAPGAGWRWVVAACLAAGCRLSSTLHDLSDRDHDGTFDEVDRCPDQPGPGATQGCPYPDADGDGIYDPFDRCPADPGPLEGCPDDLDGDGILAAVDLCPEVFGVPPFGCPIRDSDGDGFLDPDDRCPADPGLEPFGCPIRDSDGDGLLDPDDRCPTYPETRNGYKDDDGCPDEIPTQTQTFTGGIKGIYFEYLETTIKPKSLFVLDRAIAIFKEFPTIRLEVNCHESTMPGPKGYIDPAALRKFTLRRAKAVKQYFVDGGVEPDRVEVRGAGADEPVDTNKTAAGRARNRRCDFHILTQ